MNAVKSVTKKAEQKPARSGKKSDVFSDEELAAMKDYIKERKAAARPGKVNPESEVLAKIDEMSETDRYMARRIHEIVKASAPALTPRLWYGMPAYSRDGNVICFFQAAAKFKTRYATLGFNHAAKLDDGTMWPVAYALLGMSRDDEARIAALIKQASS